MMRKRLLIALSLLASNTHADINTEAYWQSQYHKQWQRFDLDRGNNPGNAILRFSDQTDRIELQPEFLLSGDLFELTLQPRATHSKERVPGDGKSFESDLSLRYWKLDYYLGEYWLKAGRYVNSWGPARLLSPSNRYHSDTGQADPNTELMAREYVEWGGQLDSNWQFQLTINTGKGKQDLEDFSTTGDLQLVWQGTQVSTTALLSKAKQGYGVGGYGQWTVNDALIVYGDFLYLSQGRKLERLLPDWTGPLSESMLAAVTGISYTFKNGWNLALDYYQNPAGLQEYESEQLLSLNREYTSQLLAGEFDIGHRDFLTRINSLPFYQLGQSYAFFMLQRNNIQDDFDVTYMRIRNLSDQSGQQALNVEYRWLDALTIYGGINYFSGAEDTEFGRFLNRQVSVGIKSYF